MIPGILPVKCYNGILYACGILHILFALINTNKHFWCRCWGNNWRKDFDTIADINANLVITSFCGITPILLNCGKDRTTEAVLTFR